MVKDEKKRIEKSMKGLVKQCLCKETEGLGVREKDYYLRGAQEGRNERMKKRNQI
jgi:hypothetical protein